MPFLFFFQRVIISSNLNTLSPLERESNWWQFGLGVVGWGGGEPRLAQLSAVVLSDRSKSTDKSNLPRPVCALPSKLNRDDSFSFSHAEIRHSIKERMKGGWWTQWLYLYADL